MRSIHEGGDEKMKSTWMSKLIEWLDGRAEASGKEENKAKPLEEKERRSHARARRVGFFRFYGQRLVEAVQTAAKLAREKRLAERALLVAAGAAVALVASDVWDRSALRPPTPFELQAGFEAPAGPWSVDVARSPLGEPALEEGVPREGAWSEPEWSEPAGSGGSTELPAAGGLAIAESGRAPAVLDVGVEAELASVAARPEVPAAAPDGRSSAGEEERLQVAPRAVEPRRAEPSLPSVSITSMVWPVSGGELVRQYGWYRHPVFGDWRYASSVVIKPGESGEVQAALAGRVRDVVDEGGLWRVSIEHAGGWRTEYEGLTEVAVASYQLVETGQVIGRAVTGGEWGVGFAVRQGQVAVNPLSLMGGEAPVPVMAP